MTPAEQAAADRREFIIRAAASEIVSLAITVGLLWYMAGGRSWCQYQWWRLQHARAKKQRAADAAVNEFRHDFSEWDHGGRPAS